MARIYVASLADYNAGRLHGAWIDLDGATETSVQAEIDEMLAASPEPHAEEWAIHDYDGFDDLKLGEHEDIGQLIKVAEMAEEHGDVFYALVNHFGTSYLDTAVQHMEEEYQGAHRSLEEWAEEWLEETGTLADIPDNLKYYFDYEKYARDAELGGDIFTLEVDGMVHVFYSR